MVYYVGFDVSDKQTSVCVLFTDGNLAWQGEVDTGVDFISSALSRWGEEIELVGLETGSLTPWLARRLRDAGFPIVVMDDHLEGALGAEELGHSTGQEDRSEESPRGSRP